MEDIIPTFDPDFEPQSRPRSGTWPLRRPNIEKANQPTLATTMEESGSQVMLADLNENDVYAEPKSEYDMFSGMIDNSNSLNFPLDNVLVGSPNTTLVTQLSTLQERPASENNNIDLVSTQTTVTELQTQKHNYDNGGFVLNQQNNSLVNSLHPSDNLNFAATTESSLLPASTPTQSSSAPLTPKAKSSRKNAWGNMSYADLITQAIEDSPEKRLTLAQIYEWMVKHIPYFKDKGDSNSSAGWKVCGFTRGKNFAALQSIDKFTSFCSINLNL